MSGGSSTTITYVTSGLSGPDAFPLPTDQITAEQAQTFGVYSQYTPTKISAFLRPSGIGDVPYLYVSQECAIDALNFSDIKQKTNKIFPSTSFSGYSGHGSLAVEEFDPSKSYAIIKYPVKVSSAGNYTIYFRCETLNNPFSINVYFDDVLVHDVSTNIAVLGVWNWFYITVTIPDTEVHELGVSLQQADSALDKIVISDGPITAGGSNNYSNPYITVHAMLYTLDEQDRPDDPLFIYDYKTTRYELRTDDWYNFDLNFLDSSRAVPFDNKYALVLFAAGSTPTKYIVWDLVDSDAYEDAPSSIKA